MRKMKFTEGEIPYETLEPFGLTKEMIEDLPTEVINDLLEGRRSPVLPITIKDNAGNTIKSHSRFSLIRKEGDQVDVLFYPKLTEADLSKFNKEEQDMLSMGNCIISDVEQGNGNAHHCFVQVDFDTKQVLSVPTQVIGKNLQIVADDIHLTSMEYQSLQKGIPITFTREDEEAITVGIDLSERTGIRFCSGDSKAWKEERKRDWDKYTFGIFGCWVMGDDGYLGYVSEDEYTEEIWNEQRKAAAQSMLRHMH